MRNFILSAFTIILLFGAVACGSSRKAAVVETPQETQTARWSTFYAPVTVDIERPMNLAVSGRATMENGKYIHLSMRFLGMEVVVVYVDADSVYFVDKFHKYLFAESLPKILGDKYKNLTVSDIQKILLGQTNLPATKNVSFVPSMYITTPAGRTTSKITVNVENSKADVTGSWEWSEFEAKWNEDNRKVSFKAPDNYTRITLENLDSVLKSLSL